MSNELKTPRMFGPISYGKARYEPGAPKGLPRWFWACMCPECNVAIPIGPFKTRRQAELNSERAICEVLGVDSLEFIDGGELPSIAQH